VVVKVTTRPDAAFLARRARLLMGMTQGEFAGMMGVEDATVSRWERGRLYPSPKLWSRIREIALRAATPHSDELIRASYAYKLVVRMDDLTTPTVVSEGVAEALAKVHLTPADLAGSSWSELAHASSHYDISLFRALKIIGADKRWLSGEIAYAEAHAFSAKTGEWFNLMVAPLPDRYQALIEAVRAVHGKGFWTRLVPIGDLVA
jgi:transcriptional regulator with XRE-family HTH domain